VGLRTHSARDRHLLFSLLGVLLGMAFTLTTVWLGAQSFELLFLLVGWSQVIRPGEHDEATQQEAVVRQLLQQSEAIKVYT